MYVQQIFRSIIVILFFFLQVQFDTLSCLFMSHCQNSSKFLSVSYLMKTADVIMNFSSSHNTTDHT